jgi:beta-lactamase class A
VRARPGRPVARAAGLLLLAPTLLVVPAAAQPADAGLARLEREIARLAELSGGVMGVAAIHLETGRAVYHNRDIAFPMASSYKVPIAVELLTRVDRGEKQLDAMVELVPEDVHPGSGTISQLFQVPGVALSLRNLLELTMLISDNSATDVVLREAGGPAAVTARLRALGIDGMRVDRPTSLLIADFSGVTGAPADGRLTLDAFRRLAAAVTPEQRAAAARAFDADPRDTSTPYAMGRLLTLIADGGALSRESADLLLDIMLRSTTGAGRLKGMLPPYVDVSHKTGTIGGTTNDVGIIMLPDGGRVVTVAFVKESSRPVPEREAAIAQVARAVYDYFLFNPGTDRE